MLPAQTNPTLRDLYGANRPAQSGEDCVTACRTQQPQIPGSDSLPFFVPLRLKREPAHDADLAAQAMLEIVLPNGLRLRVPPHFDSGSLQQYLSMLRGVLC